MNYGMKQRTFFVNFITIAWLSSVIDAVDMQILVEFEGYTLDGTPFKDTQQQTRIECLVECSKNENCKSASVGKNNGRCLWFDVSIAAIGSVPRRDSQYDTYTNGWNSIVKYSAGGLNYNNLGVAEFYNTDNYAASFPDDICGVDPAQKCSRPYKHTLQKELLASSDVKEVKISVYKDGSEKAWVTFSKNPGFDDVWFHPSRILDSHPWDKTQLQASTTNFTMNTVGIDWLISEGSKFGPSEEDIFSANARWLMVRKGTEGCTGSTWTPSIWYSKYPGPVHLSANAIGWVHAVNGGIYDTLGTDASNVCSTNLRTQLATFEEIEDQRVNHSYSCCRYGWVTDATSPSGYRAGLPMSYVTPTCGNAAKFFKASTDVTKKYGVFCKTGSDAVGEADTLVISVKLV